MARLNAHFWNWIAKNYAKGSVADPTAYQKKLDLTRQYMAPDMRIAEIGCGTGSTAIAHAPFVQHIHASDISTNMLTIAKEKARAQGINNITFAHAKAEDLNHGEDSLDMVMAHSVLHLLTDKEATIAGIYKMLKPGGTFVSSTVCIANQWGPKLFLPMGNFLGLLPLIRFFTPEGLLTSITDAGFEIVEQFQPNKDRAIFIVARKPAHRREV